VTKADVRSLVILIVVMIVGFLTGYGLGHVLGDHWWVLPLSGLVGGMIGCVGEHINTWLNKK
jgi:hypothetical protein